MSNTTCSVDGCTSPGRHRGQCNKHYQQLMKELFPCTIDGCSNWGQYKKTGYCKTHHLRLLKHGDPHVSMKGKAHAVQYTVEGLRICTVCGVPQPDKDYHKDASGTGGLRGRCKACSIAREKTRYAADPERRKETARAWRDSNLEYARGYDNMRYSRDKDKRIELATEHSHLRRSRMREIESERGVTRLALRKRDGDNCCYCGVEMDFNRAVGRVFHGAHATIEHIVPISRGGGHLMSNCKLACRTCNLSKNARVLGEWQPAPREVGECDEREEAIAAGSDSGGGRRAVTTSLAEPVF